MIFSSDIAAELEASEKAIEREQRDRGNYDWAGSPEAVVRHINAVRALVAYENYREAVKELERVGVIIDEEDND